MKGLWILFVLVFPMSLFVLVIVINVSFYNKYPPNSRKLLKFSFSFVQSAES
jgi:hypothetical protein